MKRVFMLGLFLILCITFVNARSQSVEHGEPTNAFQYDRIDEVKKECSSIFPPGSDHNPHGKRLNTLLRKSSFINGDWWQDSDKAPLIPYDNKTNGSLDRSSPLNLVSFWITNVDRRTQGSTDSVSIHGVLKLGITVEEPFTSKPYEQFPIFNIHPGHSELRMSFQGIIAGTQEQNGENVMCLLGNATLPPRHPDPNNPWDWIKEPGYINRSSFIQDDRILLVVHYPETFTLTKRGIHGSLKSLHPKSSQKYFDEIQISAVLSRRYANYEFSSEKLVSKSCTPYPYKAIVTNNDIGMYRGADFCHILQQFSGQDPLTIVPNWRCNGTVEFCSKLGPFKSDDSINTSNGSFKGVILNLEEVKCEETKGTYGSFTKVAAVIRVVLPWDPFYVTGAPRTGLNNMMLSAEGMWESSSGQLCMVGCRGIVDEEGEGCDTRICLYIPLTFSIKQRSIILGSISSIEESNTSYFPLEFQKRVRYGDLYDHYSKSRQYYNYSKIELARTIVEKHKTFSFSFTTLIKNSFFTFPKVNIAEPSEVGLTLLVEDLTLLHSAILVSAPNRSPSQTQVELEILSLDLLFGHYLSLQEDSIIEEDTPYTERQLLNVSAQLIISGPQYSNFTDIFVEGLYHPLVGKMYLVGCRDVRASSNLLYENMDLEDGFDCRIEIVISYPPTTTFWLVSPTAKISITSQRNEVDPLFFRPIELQTTWFMYRAQREGISSRQAFEMMLQVFTPLVAIGCILSQLYYIRKNLDSVPYVSLVVLAIQAFGYGFPMVTGTGAPVGKAESYIVSHNVYKKNRTIQVVNNTVKILEMVSFLLTLRLYQRVWRSRIRLAPIQPHRVPSDRQVLLVTSFIHVLGFVCVLLVNKLQSWLVKLENYLGMVQDFFLLPQVIGNLIWRIDCKPLRKSYFVGLTLIRLLPHVYDYIPSVIPYLSSEIVDPYSSEQTEVEVPYLDFYSKLGAIGVPATTILLVIAVIVQQKWSYEKLGRIFTFLKFSFYHVGPWFAAGGSGGCTEFQRQWRRCNEEEAQYWRRLN